eukprot:TRINITY_DN11318_c0_g1_i1.p1 TRINITY_DN11318_c0_g1~~TRINITY_DN11318_c0_g1_i1.p1  ORF type:complete len:138 (-),score=18.74 TRINITY_DN11318_c0_g1_i1:19-432(-)
MVRELPPRSAASLSKLPLRELSVYRLDIACVPSTIEKLRLMHGIASVPLRNPPYFPRLRDLSMDIDTYCQCVELHLLQDSPIQSLELESRRQRTVSVWIPPNAKLDLCDVIIKEAPPHQVIGTPSYRTFRDVLVGKE